MKRHISGKFTETQERAHELFIASIERSEPPIFRLPHDHPIAEETYRNSIPTDMVIVDKNFERWFSVAIQFSCQPEHVIVLREEYEELRTLITKWAKDNNVFSSYDCFDK